MNEDRNVSFSYRIINKEDQDIQYDVDISFDNTTIENKKILLEVNEEYEENYSFILPENVVLPVKTSVNLRNIGQDVYFWIED